MRCQSSSRPDVRLQRLVIQQTIPRPDFFPLRVREGVVLFPAALVTMAVQMIPTLSLWWDFGAADRYITNECNLDAAIFPPVPLERWSSLR
jgi:hypothetical protein